MCVQEKRGGEEGLEIAHNRLSMRGALGPVSTMTNKQTNKVEKRFGSKMVGIWKLVLGPTGKNNPWHFLSHTGYHL